MREILTAVGEVVYEWSIADDIIRWGANALDVLKVASLDADRARGRAFAALLDPANLTSRHDAVLNSTGADQGDGRRLPGAVLAPPRRSGRAAPPVDRGHRPLVRRRRAAGRRGPTACSASSTSATSASSAWPFCRATTSSPATSTGPHLLATLGEALVERQAFPQLDRLHDRRRRQFHGRSTRPTASTSPTRSSPPWRGASRRSSARATRSAAIRATSSASS